MKRDVGGRHGGLFSCKEPDLDHVPSSWRGGKGGGAWREGRRGRGPVLGPVVMVVCASLDWDMLINHISPSAPSPF